jgi:hypothetical protein
MGKKRVESDQVSTDRALVLRRETLRLLCGPNDREGRPICRSGPAVLDYGS